MKHISINVSDEIKTILPDTLEKDLQNNESICPVCSGLGVVLDNNVYGIKGDTSEAAKKSMFPYNRQAIKFCPNCYNGVIRLCEYCGKQIAKGYINKCDCEQYKAKEEEEKRIKYQETIQKAKEVDIKSVTTYLYDEETDHYFAEIDDFVDEYKDNMDFADDEEMLENLPEVLWVCSESNISMDAYSIVENVFSDLHEDAFDNVSDGVKELQDLLDNWCNKQSGTKTYYPCYKEYVRVKKEWFK